MSDDWETAAPKKAKNVNKPISCATAMRIQITENIDNFYYTIMSEESIKLQTDGYRYMRVVRGGKDRQEGCKYISVDNKYGDELEFKPRRQL